MSRDEAKIRQKWAGKRTKQRIEKREETSEAKLVKQTKWKGKTRKEKSKDKGKGVLIAKN